MRKLADVLEALDAGGVVAYNRGLVQYTLHKTTAGGFDTFHVGLGSGESGFQSTSDLSIAMGLFMAGRRYVPTQGNIVNFLANNKVAVLKGSGR